jgi:ribosomal protein S18 acetylase RimI-like enzyme
VLRPFTKADLEWAERLMTDVLGGRVQARRGELVDVLDLPGFIVERGGEPLGLLTYRWLGDECELAAIAVREPQRGAGTELLEALTREVAGRARIWLVTTNDNLEALRFYQRRGYRLVRLSPGAVDHARRELKPEIPPAGAYGIPIRDELELELVLELP